MDQSVKVHGKKTEETTSVKIHRIPIALWWGARTRATNEHLTVSQYVINLIREAVEKK